MPEPESMTLVLLREMGADLDRRFADVNGRFDTMDDRFDKLDKKLENVRQAMHGESLPARYAVAEVDERFEAIERRLKAFEERG
jgi:chaperonin cofactor prefoldin